jgi:hypothetical protein
LIELVRDLAPGMPIPDTLPANEKNGFTLRRGGINCAFNDLESRAMGALISKCGEEKQRNSAVAERKWKWL